MSAMNPIVIASVLACVVVWFDFLRASKKRQRENEKAAFLSHTGLVPVEINTTRTAVTTRKKPRVIAEDSFNPTMFWVSIIGGSLAGLGSMFWLAVQYVCP